MLSRMKTLWYGILLIVLIGIGGLVYRNAVEHPSEPIACPMDAKVCPDGTSVGRTGLSCTFPECPPPNVSLEDIHISFAVPAGFAATESSGAGSVAAYTFSPAVSDATSTAADIIIRRYAISASSTPLSVIQATAIGGTSGGPVSVTTFTPAMIAGRTFTVVSIERFEGIIDTAYYLRHGTDMLRFDAIDREADWTNPSLDLSLLPAHRALIKLLGSLQGI